MSKNYIIVVTGPCGSGKTSIAKSIQKEFNYPLINKDAVKEMLYDTVGYTDREFSEKLGRASYSLLYYFAEQLLIAESSFIIESNFSGSYLKGKIEKLKQEHDFEVIIVRCFADKEVLFKRVIERDASGERHPGHIYPTNYEEFHAMLLEKPVEFMDVNVDIGEYTIDVDTTIFNEKTFSDVFESILRKLNSSF